jgi:hypothetical protein
MASKRTGFAPYSLAREAGVESATVNGTIDVIQEIRPTINAGFLDEVGNWKGKKSSDETFFGFTKGEAIAGGTTFLTPSTNDTPSLDMRGFRHLQIAILCSRSISIKLEALSGPDSVATANLTPVHPANLLKMTSLNPTTTTSFDNVLRDTAESVVANAWVIFTIYDRMADQINMQVRIGNEDASAADFEAAFRRLV